MRGGNPSQLLPSGSMQETLLAPRMLRSFFQKRKEATMWPVVLEVVVIAAGVVVVNNFLDNWRLRRLLKKK